MKALLCCEKKKPMLRIAKEEMKNQNRARCYSKEETNYFTQYIEEEMYEANGKIVAECDFEVEEMKDYFNSHSVEQFNKETQLYFPEFIRYITGSKEKFFLNRELDKYSKEKGNIGYAIYIKNLKIFDYPKETGRYSTRTRKVVSDIICDSCTAFGFDCRKCPDGYDYQNVGYIRRMMKVYGRGGSSDYIAIPVTPEEMCRIANGEQTIIIRRNVLKEMKS